MTLPLDQVPETALTRGVQRRVLDNGLTVLARPLATRGVVAFHTWVKAGYTHEEDVDSGLAHLIEHMWFKGSAGLPQEGALAHAIKGLGGVSNAGTIYDHTHYYFVLPSQALPVGLALMGDTFQRPLFDAERMAREREVVIEESNRKKDRPGAFSFERMLATAFTQHRIRRWRIGADEVLRATTRERLVDFYRGRYTAPNMVLAVAGDLDPEQVFALAEEHFGGLSGATPESSLGPDEPEQRGFRFATEHGAIQQPWSLFGFRTVEAGHDDELVLDVAGALMAASSRLPEHAVGAGRLAGLSACSNLAIPQVGLFALGGYARTPAELAAGEQQLLLALDALRRGDVHPWELERVLRRVEASFWHALESASGVSQLLSGSEARGSYREPDRYLARLRTVTVDDVVRVSRRYFQPERATLYRYLPEGVEMALDPDAVAARIARPTTEPAPQFRVSRPPLTRTAAVVAARRSSRGDWGERSTLGNGVTLVTLVDRSLPLVSLSISQRGGRREESADQRGLTEMMLRSSIRGAGGRTATEWASDLSYLGAGVGYRMGQKASTWELSGLTEALPKALPLLLDVIQQPHFDEEELARERGLQRAELAQKAESPSTMGALALREALFGAGHRYTWWTEGTEETIEGLDRAQLAAWRARLAHPGRMVVCAAGDIDPDALARALEAAIPARQEAPLALPEHPAPTLRRGARMERRTSDKAQSAIYLAFPTVDRSEPDRFPLAVLATLCHGLAGRFGRELRSARSLAYSVAARSQIRSDCGYFYGYLSTAAAKEAEAIEALREQFALLRAGVREEEVAWARGVLLGSYPLKRQSLAARRSSLQSCTLLGRPLSYPETYLAGIGAVTRADVQRVIERYLDPAEEVLGVCSGKSAEK